MNTARIYTDSEGNKCTIHQVVRREPEWAASRIQVGEDLAVKCGVMKKELRELRATNERLMNPPIPPESVPPSLLAAARLAAKWMRWWLDQNECECEGSGHSCGRHERMRELRAIEETIKIAGKCAIS